MRTKHLASANDGSVSIIFGLIVVVLMGMAGLALDYSIASSTQRKADEALDAAALAAARAGTDGLESGRSGWESEAKSKGLEIFAANFGNDPRILRVKPELELTRSGNSVEVRAQYDLALDTALLKVLGISQLEITGSATASSSVPTYIDLHLLVDLSSSMGIGSTSADQHMLNAATGCAIACHVSFPWDRSNYAAARSTSAKLRIDVVRDAVVSMLNTIETRTAGTEQVRISIDGFSNEIIPILSPTTTISTAIAAAAQIDLKKGYSVGSNISHAIKQLTRTYRGSGSGMSPNDRKSLIVMISDGVENSMSPLGSPNAPAFFGAVYDRNFVWSPNGFNYNSFQRMQALDTAACEAAKADGHQVLIGSIDYLEPSAVHSGLQNTFDRIEREVKPRSLERFRTCASRPDWAFHAVASKEIEPMLDAILDQVLGRKEIRLTQ